MIKLPDETIDTLFKKFVFPYYEYGGMSAAASARYEYPDSAIREMVTNAIVHMDYSRQRPVTIALFPDRMRVFCAGGLPKGMTLESLKSEHDSIRRNEGLASAFFSAGMIEAWGQGIAKAIRACAENGNPEPEFYEMSDGLAVNIYPRPHKQDSSVTGEPSLDDRIVRLMRADPRIRIKDLARTLNVSDRTVRYHISKLKDEGAVTRTGGRSEGEWIVDVKGHVRKKKRRDPRLAPPRRSLRRRCTISSSWSTRRGGIRSRR